MTETAKTIIQVGSAFSSWVASHIVALGAVITATLPILQIMKVMQLTTDELAGLQLGILGIVSAITGQGTVSKIRMNERVEEKVEQKLEARVEARVAQITGTGNGDAKP